MGKRGPVPKPTALKAAQGNPGKRALKETEPVPPAGDIVAPTWLKGSALGVWKHLAPIAESMRVLTTADVLTFARYCALYGEWLDFRAMSQKAGKRSKWAAMSEAGSLRKLAKDLLLFEREFGFTPSSRTRIEVEHASGAAPAAAVDSRAESDFDKDFPATSPIPFRQKTA